jgi:cardiolipin synthase A/B
MGWILFLILAGLCIVVALGLLFLVLFEPAPPYDVSPRPQAPLDSHEFALLLGKLTDAEVYYDSRVEVLCNGDAFYERMLADIRSARHSVNEEHYIFNGRSRVAQRFLDVWTERAKAGARVNLTFDAIGSFSTKADMLDGLRAAGGRVAWYHPFRWYTIRHLNNRTHRNVLVVDGRVGYTGGAGVRDWWLGGEGGKPQWRDTMFRVEGPLVTGLQSAFLENWIDAAGQILADRGYFPYCADGADGADAADAADGGGGRRESAPAAEGAAEPGCTGMVVISNAEGSGVTRARILFQTLLACARESVLITTPYFVPDKPARQELMRCVERGVKVTLLAPGRHTDQVLTYRSGRRRYGQLLKAGVEVYEYQPAMIHAKTMVIDGVWSVFGTTNYDSRSFAINDEINVAAQDRGLAARLRGQFEQDLAASKRMTYADWRRRPLRQRVIEWAGLLLERHQ